MGYILDLNPDRCVACGACVVACMDQNDIEVQAGDLPLRKCVCVEEGQGADVRISYLSVGCMHCADAPCIRACPVGCIRRDEDTSFVVYDNKSCIGCRSCAMSCPFAAPAFDAGGRMQKCDGCCIRVKRGLQPACVSVCPFDALSISTKEEFTEKMSSRAANSIVAAINRHTARGI